MTNAEQLQQDLDYVRTAVRRREQSVGIPALYLLIAACLMMAAVFAARARAAQAAQ